LSTAGRTDAATLHPDLRATLRGEGITALMAYPESSLPQDTDEPVCIYGEGIGPKIQGNPYGLPEHEFRVFDIKIGTDPVTGWLPPEAVHDVARQLGLQAVPVISRNMALVGAEAKVRRGFPSMLIEGTNWSGDDSSPGRAEGLVLKSRVPLYTGRGARVMLKIKHKDLLAQRKDA
jgi:hypothetical protein